MLPGGEGGLHPGTQLRTRGMDSGALQEPTGVNILLPQFGGGIHLTIRDTPVPDSLLPINNWTEFLRPPLRRATQDLRISKLSPDTFRNFVAT